jgi:hypothetical protein
VSGHHRRSGVDYDPIVDLRHVGQTYFEVVDDGQYARHAFRIGFRLKVFGV